MAKDSSIRNSGTITVKKDRPGSLYQITRSVRPECLKMIDAQLVTRNKKIIMRKWCPDHGWSESLISKDASRALRQMVNQIKQRLLAVELAARFLETIDEGRISYSTLTGKIA